MIAAAPLAGLISDGLWSCAFRTWTGFACPTCGTARAAVALAHLDFAEALGRYPLPALAWILFLLGGLGAAAMALSGRTPPAIPNRLPGWARVGLVAMVLANWMYSIATGV